MTWSSARQFVVPYLDYEARCSLRCCSKSDKLGVDSSDFFADSIEISESPSRELAGKSTIRVKIDSFTIWFVGKDDVTRVDRAWNGELDTELSEIRRESRYDVARRFFDRIELKAKSIVIQGLSFPPSPQWKLNCHHLHLHFQSDPGSLCSKWLAALDPPTLRSLDAHSWELNGIGELIAKMHISESLKLGEESDLTDEQLEGVGALNLNLNASGLGQKALKKTLERFLENGGLRDELIIYTEFPDDCDPISLLPEGAEFVRRASDIPSTQEFLITGGFKNVHNIICPREFRFAFGGIFCFIRTPPEAPGRHVYHLWPFTLN